MKDWLRNNKKLVVYTGIFLSSMLIFFALFFTVGRMLITRFCENKGGWVLDLVISEFAKNYLSINFELLYPVFIKLFVFALLLAASITLLIKINLKKRIYIFSGLIIFFIINYFVNCSIYNFSVINKNFSRMFERSDELIKKAQGFDKYTVLNKLSRNSLNGFYYRLDDNINEATYKEFKAIVPKYRARTEFFDSYEFRLTEDGKLELQEGISSQSNENTAVLYKYKKGDYFETLGTFVIRKRYIQRVEMRIKVKHAKIIDFLITEKEEAILELEGQNISHVPGFSMDVIPDNLYHTYTVPKRHMFSNTNGIKKIFLWLKDVKKDEVQIEYLRFISRQQEYEGEPLKAGFEHKNKEWRKGIFVKVPSSVTYKKYIPKGRTYISFGYGARRKRAAIEFELFIKDQSVSKKIHSGKILYKHKWEDIKIDISEWTGKELEFIFSFKNSVRNKIFLSNPVIYTLPPERRNVIIVLQDTLRADSMSCYGYHLPTTPRTDEFIKDGIQFLHAFSQTTETRTSCASMMTSLYPMATGVISNRTLLDDRYLTLAEVLRSQGFVTSAFIQNPNGGRSTRLHRGYGYHFDRKIVGKKPPDLYNDRLFDWLEENRARNFFLYMHIYDPHDPYEPQEPFDKWHKDFMNELKARPGISKEEIEELAFPKESKLLYDGEIRSSDHYFGKFLDKLREYKLLEDTLVILIADHGEHFYEHGKSLWKHRPPSYIQCVNVPMLMVYPKLFPRDKKISQLVQLLDLFPTILDVAGVDKERFLIQGDSLLSLIQGEDLDFWDDRAVLVDESSIKHVDKRSEWFSLFFNKWHIIHSGEFISVSKFLKDFAVVDFIEFMLGARLFNFIEDKKELNYINSFFADIITKYRIKRFIRTLQGKNQQIQKHVKTTHQEPIYDPQYIKHLRALGYLQ